MIRAKGYCCCVLLMLFGLSCSKLLPVDVGTGQGSGVVRRVDTLHKMITLEHSTIPNLVTGMTMAYRVNSADLLYNVRTEDSVNFTLTETAPGEFTLMSIGTVHTPSIVEKKNIERRDSTHTSTAKP